MWSILIKICNCWLVKMITWLTDPQKTCNEDCRIWSSYDLFFYFMCHTFIFKKNPTKYCYLRQPTCKKPTNRRKLRKLSCQKTAIMGAVAYLKKSNLGHGGIKVIGYWYSLRKTGRAFLFSPSLTSCCSFALTVWAELIPAQIPRDYDSCQNRKYFLGLILGDGTTLTLSHTFFPSPPSVMIGWSYKNKLNVYP